MRTDEINGILIISSIVMILFWIIYDIFKNQNGSITAYLLWFMVLSLNFLILFGDMIPAFRRGQLFMTITGLVGTIQGVPTPEHGGRYTYNVCFERRYVPKDIRKRVDGAFSFVRDFISGTITIPITAERNLFEEVPHYDSENRDGAILFKGSISGGNIRNPNFLYGIEELKRMNRINAYMHKSLSSLEEQLANIANMKTYDAKAMSQELSQISDNVKRTIIMARGGGITPEAVGADSIQTR